jgi:hypothetical protein
MKTVRIALVEDYDPAGHAHQAIPQALQLSGKRLGVAVDPRTSTLGVDEAQPAGSTGVWCVSASPYANAEADLAPSALTGRAAARSW